MARGITRCDGYIFSIGDDILPRIGDRSVQLAAGSERTATDGMRCRDLAQFITNARRPPRVRRDDESDGDKARSAAARV